MVHDLEQKLRGIAGGSGVVADTHKRRLVSRSYKLYDTSRPGLTAKQLHSELGTLLHTMLVPPTATLATYMNRWHADDESVSVYLEWQSPESEDERKEREAIEARKNADEVRKLRRAAEKLGFSLTKQENMDGHTRS